MSLDNKLTTSWKIRQSWIYVSGS